MATTHISVAEAARDFAALIERVRAGEEIVIEEGPAAVALLNSAQLQGRPISRVIAALEFKTRATGEELTMGTGFAQDVEELIAARTSWDPPAWD